MAPFLPDDLLREILLRLPWHEPSCLARTSLVCKHWHDLVTDPGFHRRLRRAPVLGVFQNNPPAHSDFIPAIAMPDTISLLRPPEERPWYVRDCRRGLVLLCDRSRILVWDPTSDSRFAVPHPPVCHRFFFSDSVSTALLRPRGDDRRSSFGVAIAFVQAGVAIGAVYSSGTDAWATAQAPAPGLHILWEVKPGAVVGDAVNWLLNGCRVLKLQLQAGGQQAAMAVLEPSNVPNVNEDNVQLMRTHDGALGLAAVTGLALRQWTLTKTGDNHVSWTPCTRTIRFDESLFGTRWGRRYPGRFREEKLSLATVLALLDCREAPAWGRVAGVDEDGSTLFLWRMDGIFMLRLQPNPPRIRKICQGIFVLLRRFAIVFPYSCFFFGGNIVT